MYIFASPHGFKQRVDNSLNKVVITELCQHYTFKFPVEKTLANSSLSFTGGIAPMHMLVPMYYCVYMFSYGPYGPEIKHYYYYYRP